MHVHTNTCNDAHNRVDHGQEYHRDGAEQFLIGGELRDNINCGKEIDEEQ